MSDFEFNDFVNVDTQGREGAFYSEPHHGASPALPSPAEGSKVSSLGGYTCWGYPRGEPQGMRSGMGGLCWVFPTTNLYPSRDPGSLYSPQQEGRQDQR